MRISDWSSDVCSSDLGRQGAAGRGHVVLLDTADILLGHGPWAARQVGAERDRGGGNRLPAARVAFGNVIVAFPGAVGARLAAGVGDLAAGPPPGPRPE